MNHNFNIVPETRVWLVVLPVIVPVILVSLILITPQQAFAVTRDTYVPACGLPVIDGEVQPLEWNAAYTQTVQLHSGSVSEPFTATVRVMNAAANLYLGITIDDDEFTTKGEFLDEGDGFRIDFDNDHGISLFALNDDVLNASAGLPQFRDSYIKGMPAPSSSADDVDGGGSNDGQAAASRVGNLNHFEIKHPLCSGDEKDFCLLPGDLVGFRLEYLDAEGDGSFGGSFLYPGSSDTDQADIIISVCIYNYLPLTLNE
ncbi:MAG: hypothetical protein U9R58_04290 [Chloroflexota bacterium]|nr:hypothetical protein [Chloroflexota bacterium]